MKTASDELSIVDRNPSWFNSRLFRGSRIATFWFNSRLVRGSRIATFEEMRMLVQSVFRYPAIKEDVCACALFYALKETK